MLKIASYSLRGQIVRVKLKCTCGESRIFEVEEDGLKYFYCERCKDRKSVDQLRSEASTYWRKREWVVDCEADQRKKPRIRVDYGIELVVKATRYSPAYCGMHGRMVTLSESGALILVDDFDKDYFQDITTTHRYAEIRFTSGIDGLPPVLAGRIVGVRFRPDELPDCRIGISFDELTDVQSELLKQYVVQRLETPPVQN